MLSLVEIAAPDCHFEEVHEGRVGQPKVRSGGKAGLEVKGGLGEVGKKEVGQGEVVV